jgi:hypothetical protein
MFFDRVVRCSGPCNLFSVQIVGVEVKIARNARELHIGARRLEGHRLRDALELDAFLKFAVELQLPLYVCRQKLR